MWNGGVSFLKVVYIFKVLSLVEVNVDGELDWMIGFIAPCTFTTRDYRQYSAIAILHTLYSSSLHTHYGSQPSLIVSTQRIYT
jgi:hypothetical protein